MICSLLLLLPATALAHTTRVWAQDSAYTNSVFTNHHSPFALSRLATSTATTVPTVTAVSGPATGAAPPAQPAGAGVSPAATATPAGAPQPMGATALPGAAATATPVLTATAVREGTVAAAPAGQIATATQPPATGAQAATATVVAVESRAETPPPGGTSPWRNPVLYVVLGVLGVLVLALVFIPGLRQAFIERIRDTPPAELVLWGSILFIVILLASTGTFLFRNPAPAPGEGNKGTREQGNKGTGEQGNEGTRGFSPSPPLLVTPLPEEVLPPSPTPRPTLPPLELPEVTPPPGGQVIVLTPAADAVGWVRQGDETPNHFGDYNIYAGTFDGQEHIGAIQFELSAEPAQAGLTATPEAERPQVPPGAPIEYADLTLVGLSEQWLGTGDGAWHVELLKPWMGENWTQQSFDTLQRPDGAALELTPALSAGDLAAGHANTWVFGPEALEVLEARTYTGRVSFRIRGPDGVRDNLFTWDSGYGTGSRGRGPVLRLVVGPAPETPPPSPTPAYVIVTSEPPTETPENVVTLAARLMTATAEATPYAGTGTPTPTPSATSLPPDWVTPVVIAPTARPENVATAQWHALVATAQAFVYGTPTSLPPNVWTVTPTPPAPYLLDLSVLTPTPTVTPTPQVTPTPGAIPSVLRGRIAFRSDRLPDNGWILVVNADGTNLKLLADLWAYGFARDRQALSPDGAQRAIVENVNDVPHVFRLSLADGSRQPLTPDQLSYDPAWSPAGDWIAYVGRAPDGNEEIYLMRPDGTEKTRLTFTPAAYEKQPTWSPDGTRIAFVSNRGTGHAQVWVMNADGSGAVNLSNNEYNETDPVWLK